jgi:hypothetical protein
MSETGTPIPIDRNAPLRLAAAAEAAFPGGGMTASGLRRESRRGRLVIERIAGKDYTTLAEIERMRQLCRTQKAQGCTLEPPASGEEAVESVTRQHGSSATPDMTQAQNALATTLRGLKKPSPITSLPSTSRRRRNSAPVIHLQSH